MFFELTMLLRVYLFRPIAQPLPGYANRMACCITGWPVVYPDGLLFIGMACCLNKRPVAQLAMSGI